IEKTFYLNTWLQEHGYLAVADGGGGGRDDLRLRVKKAAKDVLEKLGLLEAALKWTPDRVRGAVEDPAEIWSRIDWSNTKAFAAGQYVGQIYLNTEQDYPQGTVSDEEYERVRDELVAELREIEDPATGEPVVEKVWTRDDLYREFAEFAPDITFYTSDMKYKVKEELHGSVFDESIPRGAHGKQGVFIAAGPDFRGGEASPDLVDLAPTLLHLQGAAVPVDMDGDVADIFAAGSDPAERDVEQAAADRDATEDIDI
ncbi:MAG: hypothetical protein ABEK12_00975, partial [Candidatus Nanohaloarchaea archaeon]